MSIDDIKLLAAVISIVFALWKFTQGVKREVKQDFAPMYQEMASIRTSMGDLRERMARLEGLFEGFTGRKETPGT